MKLYYNFNGKKKEINITGNQTDLQEITFIGKGSFYDEKLDLDNKFIQIIDIITESSSSDGYDIQQHLNWRDTGKAGRYIIPIRNGEIIHTMRKGFSTFIFNCYSGGPIKDAVVKKFLEDNKDNINFSTEKERLDTEKQYKIDLSTGQEESHRYLLSNIIESYIQKENFSIPELKDKLEALKNDEGRSNLRLSETEKKEILLELLNTIHIPKKITKSPHRFISIFYKTLGHARPWQSECTSDLISEGVFTKEYVQTCSQISLLIAKKIFTIHEVLQLSNNGFNALNDPEIIKKLENGTLHIRLLEEPKLHYYLDNNLLTLNNALTILENQHQKDILCLNELKDLIRDGNMTVEDALKIKPSQNSISKIRAHFLFMRINKIPHFSIIADAETYEDRKIAWSSFKLKQEKTALAAAIYPQFSKGPTLFMTKDGCLKPAVEQILLLIAEFVWGRRKF